MLKQTHLFAGTVLVEGFLLYNNLDLENVVHPRVFAENAPAIGAAMIGSIFPDIDIKISGLSHRTLTHWPLLYGFGILAAKWSSDKIVMMFCLGCLMHIFLDAFTKRGVPVFHPFGKKYGVKLVRVGGISEMFFCLVIFIAALGLWQFWH
ncbi:MAG: metal-dependent hydrolase [Desulfobacteraceae bacterium]|nr:metal-dependent hydrolase [Desulfobacteraceae bacterium]